MRNSIDSTKALLNGPRSIRKDNFGHVTSLIHGKITPLYFKEILPGDTFQPSTGLSIRMNPLTTPIFDDIYFDQYWFWVPYRIIWNQSKQFFGENDVSAWTQQLDLEMPHGSIQLSVLDGAPQSLGDYIYGSVASPDNYNAPDVDLNDLPLRAYLEIYNQWFRNQNVQDPVLYNKDFTSTDDNSYDLTYEDEPISANRFHSVDETLLPEPVKGDLVTIGLSGTAPLVAVANDYLVKGLASNGLTATYNVAFGPSIANGEVTSLYVGNTSVGKGAMAVNPNSSGEDVSFDSMSRKIFAGSNDNTAFKTNLVANLDQATAVTINDLYYAECLSRYRYLLGVGGSRYQEYVRTFFDVIPNANVLDYPEYLFGKRTRLNIDQVLSHGETSVSDVVIPLGEVGGYSFTNDKTRACFTKTFQEHGLIMCVGVCRHATTWAQAFHPFAFKKNHLDIYVPPFANIYDVPFFKKYIFPYIGDAQSIDDTLGFAEPWWDYKHEINRVSGYMNPIYDGSLKTYSLARVLDGSPTLVSSFIQEDRKSIQRVTAGSFNFDYMISFYVDYTIARRMPVNSIPGDIIGKIR